MIHQAQSLSNWEMTVSDFEPDVYELLKYFFCLINFEHNKTENSENLNPVLMFMILISIQSGICITLPSWWAQKSVDFSIQSQCCFHFLMFDTINVSQIKIQKTSHKIIYFHQENSKQNKQLTHRNSPCCLIQIQ